jgi:5'-nucleotidase / UDP-sugar diphosphatase
MKKGLIALIVITVMLIVGCQKPNLQKPITVTVLFTNDTKSKIEGCGCKKAGGGLLKRAYEIKQTQKEKAYSLYFDTGDFLFGDRYANRTDGKLIIDALNSLNANAVNVTPKEFTMGVDKYKAAIKDALFPAVSCNLKYAKSGKLVAEPYVLKTVAGVVFGIMGVTSDETLTYLSADNSSQIAVDDPYASIKKYLPKMKKESDVLILLSFLGYDEDNNLAKQIPDFDLILGGLTGQKLNEPDQVGATFIMQAGNEGRYLGRANVLIDVDRLVSSVEYQLVSMEANAPSDDGMRLLVQKWVPDFEYDNPADRRMDERSIREGLEGQPLQGSGNPQIQPVPPPTPPSGD